jgi:hypothetical protein
MTSLDSLSVSRPTGRIEHGGPGGGIADEDLAMPCVTLTLSLAETARYGSPAMIPTAPAAHDPTRLLAALDEIEARRAAIQWLVEADLLSLCLV